MYGEEKSEREGEMTLKGTSHPMTLILLACAPSPPYPSLPYLTIPMYRVKVANDELSQRVKFVLVPWCGPQVKVMRRAKLSVSAFFSWENPLVDGISLSSYPHTFPLSPC